MPTRNWKPETGPVRGSGIFYGWWLVGVAMIMLTLMSVTVFQGLGTFFVVLERQFGWSRTTISGAFSLARLQGSLIGPLEGYLVDRVGIRRMVLIGYTAMGIGFMLFSQIQSVWQFYVSFTIISFGSGLAGWLAMLTMVNNWFIRRRSMAMATAMTGIHLGGFLVPALAFGFDSQGFRVTTFGIGVVLLAIVVPVSRVIHNRPEDVGMRPDGTAEMPVSERPPKGDIQAGIEDEPEFTVRQALATPAFWLLMLVQMASNVSVNSLAAHLVPKLTDLGMTLSSAGIVVLTFTAIALPVQFVGGYIADRVPKHMVIFVFLTLQSTALLVIAAANDVPTAYLFAALYGVGFGGRMPVMMSIRGEYFGRKAFATITGVSYIPNNLVTIGGPLFAGYMFDTTGSYVVPFVAFASVGYLGGLLALFMRPPRAVEAGPPGAGRQKVERQGRI